MTSDEIREKFLKFFEARGHKIIPSASLVPENDPSVLFNTAGMQPLVPYLLGQKHPMGNRLVNVQKCVRTVDLDEVGDNRHLTFFEMLGNWSLGDYFKEDAIKWSYEFLTSEEEGLGLDKNRLYVTVFEGDKNASRDEEAEKIWQKYIPQNRIYFLPAKNNWWSAGDNGPCGPDTEIFYDINEKSLGDLSHDQFVKADDGGKVIEIWNNVFMEYEKGDGKVIGKLKQRNVDTGMGLERITMVVQKKPTVFETDLFIDLIPDNLPSVMDIRTRRIMLDHCRSIAFLISDGVRPSNKDQGYVLRRLIRRTMVHFHQASRGSFSDNDILGLDFLDIENILTNVVKKYQDSYPELDQKAILSVFREENNKFRMAINNGVRELKKIESVNAQNAFKLFESYGLTFEIIKDFAGDKTTDLTRANFDAEFKKHQEISRAGVEKKFGGHGLKLDTGELKAASEEELQKVTRLHTATHLLHAGLRKVLGDTIQQRGSDITSERLRFDFIFDRKLTDEEKKDVEKYVNDAVNANVEMIHKEMPFDKALAEGFLAFFRGKYPTIVSTYELPDWSKEVCGGPHVSRSGEVGKFKIIKDEASSAGVRRIRAIVE